MVLDTVAAAVESLSNALFRIETALVVLVCGTDELCEEDADCVTVTPDPDAVDETLLPSVTLALLWKVDVALAKDVTTVDSRTEGDPETAAVVDSVIDV